MLPFYSIPAIVLVAIVGVVAPLTFVAFLEQGKSAAEVFALRGKSLRYVTVWTAFAIAAIILAGFDGVTKCIEVIAVVLGEFIPVCFCRVYFENYDFVEQFVAENKKRLRYLLREGIGMDEFRFESISNAVENAAVEFWTKELTKKRWTELSGEEIGELMFASSIEAAAAIAEKMGEDVYWIVFAFMREWQMHVEHVRIPERAKRELEGHSIEVKTLNCIAIILANETRQVRETRAQLLTDTHTPYLPAAKISAKKAATEGILRWPNGMFETTDIRIRKIMYLTEELSVIIKGRTQVCTEQDIPDCVVHTLEKMIEAGYLRISQNGKINIAIWFRNPFMVVQGTDWNSSKTVELSAFRYVTSAMWMGDGLAFVLEKSDVIEGIEVVSGCRALGGMLKLEVDVDAEEKGRIWQQHHAICDMNGVWGKIDTFIQMNGHCLLDLPVAWLVKAVWQITLVWGASGKWCCSCSCFMQNIFGVFTLFSCNLHAGNSSQRIWGQVRLRWRRIPLSFPVFIFYIFSGFWFLFSERLRDNEQLCNCKQMQDVSDLT